MSDNHKPIPELVPKLVHTLMDIGMPKKEAIQISMLLGPNENIKIALHRLEDTGLEITPQEALNLCAQVIEEDLQRKKEQEQKEAQS